MKKIILILFVISRSFMPAQNSGEFEDKLNSLQNEFAKQSSVLDSFNNILAQKAKLIDAEKSKQNPDEDRIVELLSSTATLSNKVEAQQNKIEQLEKNIETVKKDLYKIYSVKIDSLKNLQQTGKENSEQLETEILNYTAKRLMVEPVIPALSFNPEKVLKLNLDKIKDEKERKAYREFLQNALDEINALLTDVEEKDSEVSEIITLQKKTKKFLEEIEFEGALRTQRLSVTAAGRPGDITSGLNDNTRTDGLYAQVKTYNVILAQLNFSKGTQTNFPTILPVGDNSVIDMKDYKELLNVVKKSLLEYKLVLGNKLKTTE